MSLLRLSGVGTRGPFHRGALRIIWTKVPHPPEKCITGQTLKLCRYIPQPKIQVMCLYSPFALCSRVCPLRPMGEALWVSTRGPFFTVVPWELLEQKFDTYRSKCNQSRPLFVRGPFHCGALRILQIKVIPRQQFRVSWSFARISTSVYQMSPLWPTRGR